MAFLTAAALPATRPARARGVCRMSDTPAAVSGPALNADNALKMKEIYKVKAGSKTPVCRCWNSGTFPLCDGSHNKYNEETGSNVGPLVIAAPKPEKAE